ncbi:conserved hypothetical protein [Microsporum canis CBS 113480]|uniref:Uncharacterized protein n=1 Tax=Arthroderma otae (strain ATCC MYA-4605 / CBS 113480) TaxID=554155 RepID=C5FGD1_ARTOC|nr:conserved hypothetical protein [Microsporum canis CBS 113480]EEQ29816.1 conserved hypothetical protein [Microsporum canis CBS 113480]
MAHSTTAEDQPETDGPRPSKLVKPSPDESVAVAAEQASTGSPVRRPEPEDAPQLAPDEDDELDDSDSAVGSDGDENSLQSLTSSITSYVYRNGRRYASFRGGRYCLPNDEVGLFFCFCFSSASSNIARPSRIAMTSSNIYTACSLAGGSSLRPYQTVQRGYSTSAQAQCISSHTRYRNRYLAHPAYLGLTKHLVRDRRCRKRMDLQAAIRPHSLPESQRCNPRLAPFTLSNIRWESNCIKACSLIGQTLTAPENVKRWMQEAGFVDVKEEQFKLPINTWPKDPELKLAGRYQQVQYSDALQPYALGLLVEVLGWSREEMELFLVGLRKDLANRALHGYNIVHVITARKPGMGKRKFSETE